MKLKNIVSFMKKFYNNNLFINLNIKNKRSGFLDIVLSPLGYFFFRVKLLNL